MIIELIISLLPRVRQSLSRRVRHLEITSIEEKPCFFSDHFVVLSLQLLCVLAINQRTIMHACTGILAWCSVQELGLLLWRCMKLLEAISCKLFF